jgi:hypothetical protein
MVNTRAVEADTFFGGPMKLFFALLTVLASISSHAADLTGSVTFENGLYTYSYELSASDTPISQVLVLVNSTSGIYELAPVSSTSPAGWVQNTQVGIDPNGTGDVTYFGWDSLIGPTANPVSGFSFTTSAAPAAHPVLITYLLFSPTYQGTPGRLENFYLGSVVAPDFLIPRAVIPEPETYAMLLAGLGLMALVARRRQA